MIDDYQNYPVVISYLLTFDDYQSFMRSFCLQYILRIYPIVAIAYFILVNLFIDFILFQSYLSANRNQPSASFGLQKLQHECLDVLGTSIASLLFFTVLAIPFIAAYFHKRSMRYRTFFYEHDTARVEITIEKPALDIHINGKPFEHISTEEHYTPLQDKKYFILIPKYSNTVIAIPKSKCPKQYAAFLAKKVKEYSSPFRTIKNHYEKGK